MLLPTPVIMPLYSNKPYVTILSDSNEPHTTMPSDADELYATMPFGFDKLYATIPLTLLSSMLLCLQIPKIWMIPCFHTIMKCMLLCLHTCWIIVCYHAFRLWWNMLPSLQSPDVLYVTVPSYLLNDSLPCLHTSISCIPSQTVSQNKPFN